MKNTMTTAWAIREAAGTKWNCDKMEIVFGMCLSIAHKGEKIMGTITKGSEKQIAWAEKIKIEKIAKLKNEIKEYGIGEIQETILEMADIELTVDQINEKVTLLEKKDNAIWWINNKDLEYAELALLLVNLDDKLFDR